MQAWRLSHFECYLDLWISLNTFDRKPGEKVGVWVHPLLRRRAWHGMTWHDFMSTECQELKGLNRLYSCFERVEYGHCKALENLEMRSAETEEPYMLLQFNQGSNLKQLKTRFWVAVLYLYTDYVLIIYLNPINSCANSGTSWCLISLATASVLCAVESN